MEEKIILGIDFGSTTSSIAVYRSVRSEIVPSRRHTSTIPSVVALNNRGYDTIVGHGASDQGINDHQFIITDIKSLLRRKYSDINDAAIKKKLHFNLLGDCDNKIRIVVSEKNDFPKDLAIEQVASFIFSELKFMAKNYLKIERRSLEKVIGVVLTVPEFFSKGQRQAVFDAATIAGLNVLHIISELTSVVFAYGLNNKYDNPFKVLVYDLGKEKLEVNVAIIMNNKRHVEFTYNEPDFGVISFIDVLVDYCLEGLPLVARADPYAMARLRNACEKAMETLSYKEFTTVDIDHLSDNLNFETILTREEFEDLSSYLFERALDPIKHVLNKLKLEKSAIHEVILVGGGCFIPKIKSNLKEFFGEVNVNMDINPDEVVALGAARFGRIAMLNNFSEEILNIKPTKLIRDTDRQLKSTQNNSSSGTDKAIPTDCFKCKLKKADQISRGARDLNEKNYYADVCGSAPLGYKTNAPQNMSNNVIEIAEPSKSSLGYDKGTNLSIKADKNKDKVGTPNNQITKKGSYTACENTKSEFKDPEELRTFKNQLIASDKNQSEAKSVSTPDSIKGPNDPYKKIESDSFGASEIFDGGNQHTPSKNIPKKETNHNISTYFDRYQINNAPNKGKNIEKEEGLGKAKVDNFDISGKNVPSNEICSNQETKFEINKNPKETNPICSSKSFTDAERSNTEKSTQENEKISGTRKNNIIKSDKENLLDKSKMGWPNNHNSSNSPYQLGFWDFSHITSNSITPPLNYNEISQNFTEKESSTAQVFDGNGVIENSSLDSPGSTKSNSSLVFNNIHQEKKEPIHSELDGLAIKGLTVYKKVTIQGKGEDDYDEAEYKEFTIFDIGICTSTGVMNPIIPQDSALPYNCKLKFSTLIDNQRDFFFQLYAGQRFMADDNFKLASFKVDGITQGLKGQHMYELELIYYTNHHMYIRIDEISSKTVFKGTVDLSEFRQTYPEMECMLNTKTKDEKHDDNLKLRVKLRQRAEDLSYEIKRSIGEVGSLNEDSKKLLDMANDNLKIMYQSDRKFKINYRKLYKELLKLVESTSGKHNINAERISDKIKHISVKPTPEEISRLCNQNFLK